MVTPFEWLISEAVGDVIGVELILPLCLNLSIPVDSSWMDASSLFNISSMACPIDIGMNAWLVEVQYLQEPDLVLINRTHC